MIRKKKEREVLYIRVSKDLKRFLEDEAARKDKTLSELARDILRSYYEASRQEGAKDAERKRSVKAGCA